MGIWSGQTGSLALVARDGHHVPGMPDGFRFLGLDDPLLDTAGNIVFNATAGEGVVGPNGPYTQGIWAGNPLALGVIARQGGDVPDMPDGFKYAGFYFNSLELSSNGHMGLQADVIGPDVDGYNRSVIWSGTPDSLQFATRGGMHAPGTEAETIFAFFGRHAVNGNGRTTFNAYLGGPSVSETTQYGLWSNMSGSLELVVRSGDHAPGTPDGVYFDDDFAPVTNSAGHIMFWTSLAGPDVVNTSNYSNKWGIWSNASGQLSLVARNGDHMPGTPSDVFLEELDGAVMNELGQTAFVGWLDGPGIVRNRNSGVWAQDRHGVLHLIARAGEMLDVAPGDTRQIEIIHLTGLNDRGQLALSARFTDGSQGIFISNRVAIPEPSLFALIAPVLLIILVHRNALVAKQHSTTANNFG